MCVLSFEAVDVVLFLLAMSANAICRLFPYVYFYGGKVVPCFLQYLICKVESIRAQTEVDPVTQLRLGGNGPKLN